MSGLSQKNKQLLFTTKLIKYIAGTRTAQMHFKVTVTRLVV